MNRWLPPVPTYLGAFAGGAAATCAAGAATFKYGTVRDWIEALTIVLAGGDVLAIARGQYVATPDRTFVFETSSGARTVTIPALRMPDVRSDRPATSALREWTSSTVHRIRGDARRHHRGDLSHGAAARRLVPRVGAGSVASPRRSHWRGSCERRRRQPGASAIRSASTSPRSSTSTPDRLPSSAKTASIENSNRVFAVGRGCRVD